MSFFVPPLIENPVNREEEKYNQEALKIRQENLDYIIKRQFQLVYFGHFNYADLDELSLSEFDALYNTLVEQKQEEQKAQEEEIRKAKEKSKTSRRH